MRQYLLEQGVPEERIIQEDRSTDTRENMAFSKEKIWEVDPNGKVAFATTNYHVFRAGIIATSENIKVEGIGSKTRSYYWINAFIREFIATIVTEKNK